MVFLSLTLTFILFTYALGKHLNENINLIVFLVMFYYENNVITGYLSWISIMPLFNGFLTIPL